MSAGAIAGRRSKRCGRRGEKQRPAALTSTAAVPDSGSPVLRLTSPTPCQSAAEIADAAIARSDVAAARSGRHRARRSRTTVPASADLHPSPRSPSGHLGALAPGKSQISTAGAVRARHRR